MIIRSTPKNRARRRLSLEKLEARSLMAGMPGFHNASMPLDVDNDLQISPLDALVVINQINHGGGPEGEMAADKPTLFCDVDADGIVSPLDVLAVVNELNLNAFMAAPIPAPEPAAFISGPIITEKDVECLLQRASMATSSNDAIIAIVDRSGRILGVRTESGVDAMYAGREADLVFAIDGAVAKARTAAFFSNEEAPLTSRTIRFLSQSTVTQREVESNPNILDSESTLRGPGFVAPIGTGAHFPPVVANTPPVDLFAIEHQSRDSSVPAGFDGIKGTLDDVKDQKWRFDANPAFIPADAQSFLKTFPDSYGFQSGRLLNSQGRGIATLPGGMPLYKERPDRSLALVGGVGVFFPGPNGFASHEQNFVPASVRGAAGPQSNSDRLNAPKVLEAEFIAYFAAGGTVVGPLATPVTEFEGLAQKCEFAMPSGRIDLVGITLEIFGPTPTRENAVKGAERLLQVGRANQGGRGLNTGTDQPIIAGGIKAQSGHSVPEGWLIQPHDSTVDSQFTAAEVERIINNGIKEADRTRAAIRLNLKTGKAGVRTKMVLAVSDSKGEVLGLYRMPDATVFSVDVAVAKSRNTTYYASDALEAVDRIDFNNDSVSDVPAGTALTNRTFRFLALPRYPSGSVEGTPPGDFSILTMPGINPLTGENTGGPLPASVYASKDKATVLSFDSFNPSRNFRDARNIKRQNGIVFFPGSSALYDDVLGKKTLVGGLGVSGDGVDQDDVVTVGAQLGFEAPDALRSDQYIVAGVRLPYQNFNRNPQG